MARESTVMQVRLDDRLKRAFAEAAERERTTPSGALRALVEGYVRESQRKEARRQSRLVAAAPDAAETETFLQEVQDLGDD